MILFLKLLNEYQNDQRSQGLKQTVLKNSNKGVKFGTEN